MARPNLDIHRHITDQIIAAIEAGAGEYRMPWNPRLCGGGSVTIPHNPVGHYGYRGTNILALWASQQAHGYATAEWGTYRQWLSAGAQVRNGEKGTLTVFYKVPGTAETQDNDRKDDLPSGSRFIARGAYVFNAAQVDGYTQKALPSKTDIERNATADQLIAGSGAIIREGGPSACYVPSRDEIHLPPSSAFRDAEGYYSVALHELTHWTGHEKRCNRDLKNRFGSQAYAAEELIAELGSAFLCAELGISLEPRADHAGYIENWLRVLRDDKRAIFTAASKATEAASYLARLAAPAQPVRSIIAATTEPAWLQRQDSSSYISMSSIQRN